jgi:membrane protein
VTRLKALWAAARARSGALDHLVRAAARYSKDNGGQLAAAITLPGFLSFFPLVALALSIAGYVAHYDHHAQDQITRAISGFFPGLIGSGKGQINVASIADERQTTGIVGLVGLLLGGLGWVSALRSTLRRVWHQPQLRRNPIMARVLDAGALLGIGVAVLVSLTVTAVATAAAHLVVDHTPLPSGGATEVLLRVLAIALALAGDTVLFGFMFLRLPERGGRFRHVAKGALFAAVGFEILKSVGAIYISRTTHNPLYASFAVIIGLLVWVNLTAQLFLFSAVWTVTAPYSSDVEPSGTTLVDVPPAMLRTHVTTAPAAAPAGIGAARLAGTASLGVLGAASALVLRHALRSARIVLSSDRPPPDGPGSDRREP